MTAVPKMDTNSVKAALDSADAKFRSNRMQEAAAEYRAILRSGHNEPHAFMMLGLIARAAGKLELALQLMDAALEIAPDMAQAMINRAVVLRQMNRLQEAGASAAAALAKAPDMPEALDTAGYLARENGDRELAVELSAKAASIAPEDQRVSVNHAVALFENGDLPQAYRVATAALKKDPEAAYAHMTLGMILRAAGYPENALPHFRRAYSIQPDYIDARTWESAAHLVMGDWENGFPLWESRPYDSKRFAHLPLWRGERVNHLILHAEQGFGDAVHFLRYASIARRHVDRLTVQVPRPLLRLAHASLPDIEFTRPDVPPPAADAHLPLMSMARMMRTTLDAVPPPWPVAVSDADRAVWKAKVQKLRWPKIGLARAGNPAHPNDRNRSLAMSDIAALLSNYQENIVSLEKNANPPPAGVPDFGSLFNDFADTAAAISELDLVISIDSSIAHLAANMGKPVWMPTAFDPDWRWLYGREDSAWYPSLRLFRQERPQDWRGVMDRIMGDLARLVRGDTATLIPKKHENAPFRRHPSALDLGEIIS